MVPIVVPSGKKEEKSPKAEAAEKAPQRREREREENAALRRHVNGVSVAARSRRTWKTR